MDQFLLDVLGPAAGIPMLFSAILVWLLRHKLTKGHAWALIGLTAMGMVAFFAVLVAALGHRLPDWLANPLLYGTGWLTVGAATGFHVALWLLWLRRGETPAVRSARARRPGRDRG